MLTQVSFERRLCALRDLQRAGRLGATEQDRLALLALVIWPDGPPPLGRSLFRPSLVSEAVSCEALLNLGPKWSGDARCSRRSKGAALGLRLCGLHLRHARRRRWARWQRRMQEQA